MNTIRAVILIGVGAVVGLWGASAEALCTATSGTTWSCGTTGNATSLRVDLDALHNSNNPGVLKNGDTVNVPPGTFDFSTELGLNSGKCFHLVGSGVGVTILRPTGPISGAMIRLQPSNTCGDMEVTGFTFDANGFSNDLIETKGRTSNFRYHHNACIVFASKCIWNTHSIFGVIDHNTFTWPASSPGGVPLFIHHCGYDNDTWDFAADRSRAAALNLGGTKVLTIEDNTFTNNSTVTNQTFAIDGWCGQRVTVRFNTFNNAVISTHGEHDSSAKQGGNKQFEYYRNKMNFVMAGDYESFLDIRGGTGMSFHNKITTTGTGSLGFVSYFKILNRENNYYPWGPCNGTGVYDGNFGGSFPAGYPCYGQVGWHGGGLMNSKAFLPDDTANRPVLVSSGVPQWPTEVLSPVYTWKNLINGAEDNVGVAANSTAYIVSDREFYKYNASCVAGGSCNSGTGQGTSLPTSCTNGTGFWLTNAGSWNTSTTETYSDTPGEDGLHYKCVGGTMVLNYTPLTYPHPLVTGGGGSTASASITSPVAGSNQTASSIFAVSGTATPGTGSLTQVAVYLDGVLACTDTVAPFTSWTCNVSAPATPGIYVLTARATDADGEGPPSAGVSINVIAGGGGGGGGGGSTGVTKSFRSMRKS